MYIADSRSKQEFARSDALTRHMQREICPPLKAKREKRLAEEKALSQFAPPGVGTMPQALPPDMAMNTNGLGVIFPQGGGGSNNDASQTILSSSQ